MCLQHGGAFRRSWRQVLLFAQKVEDSEDCANDGQELEDVDKIDLAGHPDFHVANLVFNRLDLVFYE
jgi:hypothetical protein